MAWGIVWPILDVVAVVPLDDVPVNESTLKSTPLEFVFDRKQATILVSCTYLGHT